MKDNQFHILKLKESLQEILTLFTKKIKRVNKLKLGIYKRIVLSHCWYFPMPSAGLSSL